jgi:DNA polymerase-4
MAQEQVRAGLAKATDIVRDRFGEGAVQFGRELRTKGNLTGTTSKNPADYKNPR